MTEENGPFGKVRSGAELALLPPLALAYVGDAVYELYVRIGLIEEGMTRTNRLHTSAVSMVKAQAQAGMVKALNAVLTEEERYIVKRGRNTKSQHVPKGSTMAEYRLATGFETLIGYLFLSGRHDRLKEILSAGRLLTNDNSKKVASAVEGKESAGPETE